MLQWNATVTVTYEGVVTADSREEAEMTVEDTNGQHPMLVMGVDIQVTPVEDGR